MSDIIQVLLLALLPAAGNFVGGLSAEFVHTSRRTLFIALHLAAGILFAVIALELAPRAFGGEAWLSAIAFAPLCLPFFSVHRLTSASIPRYTAPPKA